MAELETAASSKYDAAVAAGQKSKEKDYWLNKLSGEWVKSYFPYDYNTDRNYNGDIHKNRHAPGNKDKNESGLTDVVNIGFSPGIHGRLMQLRNGSDHRLHMILTAAVAVLLQKYTGHSDIVVGAPVLRQENDLKFINTVLPLRNRYRDAMTFKELLLQVRQTVSEATEHQNYPIEVLLNQLNLSGTGNGFPLFDVAVLVDNIHDKGYIRHTTPAVIFSFLRVGDDGIIAGEVEYNANLYDKTTVERMVIHLEQLLQGLLFNLDMPLSYINIITAEEKEQILFVFNKEPEPVDTAKTVYEWFQEQVEKYPHHGAVVFENNKLTYEELNSKANRLARLLRKRGVGPNRIAALLFDWSLDMIAAILAALKSGAAYLPIDPGYPEDRVFNILEDSRAAVVLTTSAMVERFFFTSLPGLHKMKLDILELDGVLAGQPGGNPAKVNQAADPAYVIYTSGSTGTPRGILVEHRSFVDFTGWAVEEFEHRPGYRALLSNSYASDGSIQQIFPPLVSGGTLYLVRPDLRLDAPAYVNYLRENKINNIDEVPVVMNLIFESLQLDETRELLPDLTCLSLGSEFVPIEVVRKCRRYLNHEGRIINAYGPAETSVETCTYHFDGRLEKEKSLIGKPRRNLQVYIMDKRENLCAVGVAGEICIAGFGVARGYLNRPELTAEKFDHDLRDFQDYQDEKKNRTGKKENYQKLLRGVQGGSFLEKSPPGRRRLYKTGDQGRWQADGNIEFLGRIDNQVNIRGYRVEPGEIENRLLDHGAIVEAVVLIKERGGEKDLCAYFVLHPDQDHAFTGSDIRKYLCRKLPEYMVPLYFLKLDRIPLNPNGKVDRNALPDPQISAVSNYIPPADETEEQLSDLWSEVLSVDKELISVHADFFELGGHSLKTINLIAKVQKVLKVKIPVKDIFRLKTIRKLSKFIQGAQKETFISIQPAKKKEYYALSSAQKRMYILWELSPETQLYNMFYIIPLLYGPIDKEQLQDTFKKLIHRHEALRTSFEVRGGEPVQLIHEQVDFALDYYGVKAEGVDRAVVEARIEAITMDFFQSFDLGKAPLLRAGFITLAENRHLLLIDMHHIVSDGVSQGVLEREFFALERGEELPPLRLQYKDYSEWQNRMREQGVLKQQETYWLQQFAGELPVLHLPVDYPRPPVKTYQGAFVFFSANKRITSEVNRLAAETGVTQYMVLLAVFYVLLLKYTKQEDIVVGSPITGRRHADLQDVIGMFVNMLPMRNYPASNKTFGEFLLEVKENAFQAYENQDCQFDDLIGELGVERSRNRHPLFDVVLAMANIGPDSGSPLENYSNNREGSGEEAQTGNNVQLGYMDANYMRSRYDLLMEVEEADGKIKGHVEYSPELFKRSTIERFINRYFSVLEQVTENRDMEIKDIIIAHELLTVKSAAAPEEFQDEFDL
jgi:amino acid adenylation domain-containing protein